MAPVLRSFTLPKAKRLYQADFFCFYIFTIIHLMVPLYIGHHTLHVHFTSEYGLFPGVEGEVPHYVSDGRNSARLNWNKTLTRLLFLKFINGLDTSEIQGVKTSISLIACNVKIKLTAAQPNIKLNDFFWSVKLYRSNSSQNI